MLGMEDEAVEMVYQFQEVRDLNWVLNFKKHAGLLENWLHSEIQSLRGIIVGESDRVEAIDLNCSSVVHFSES